MEKHTVKIVSSLILLTALIIGMSIFAQQLLYKESYKLEQIIDEIEKNVEIMDWDQAETGIEEVNGIWSKVKETWAALIDHQEIDNIDITLSRLKMLVQAKDLASSLSEAEALKNYIGHIPKKEQLDLGNLL